MSFLFSWTKYFTTKTDDIPTNNNSTTSTQQPQPIPPQITTNTEEKYSFSSEIESDEEDSLCGGSFETLEDEIQFLREQNTKLKQKYKYHKSQAKLFQTNLQNTGVIQMKINGKLVNIKQPQLCNLSLDELSAKVEERLPKFLQKADQIIPSCNENEIGVIDIKSCDWGDMVKFDSINKTEALSTFENENLQFEQTELDELKPFIILSETDVIDALAYFVAQCVMNIPECHNLDHEEMMQMINGTFLELKSKGPLGKMMDWGTFVYRSFGWGTTAYTVYTNAAMAKTVLSCLVSAAFFIGVL
eukprot:81514_1